MLTRLLRQIAGDHLRSLSEGSNSDGETASEENLAAESCIREGKLGQAEFHYRNAIRSDPNAGPLHYNLGLLLHKVGDIAGAEASYRRAMDLAPQAQYVYSSFLGLCDFSTAIAPDAAFRRHRQWASLFADPLTKAAERHRNLLDPRRRLRIGYVSADLREHVIGSFIGPVLALHDRKRFHLHCYSSTGSEDRRTQR